MMLFAYELTLTDVAELETKLNQFPTDAKIHLPDKPNIYPNLILAKQIQNRDLGITFSVGNHYHGGNLNLIVSELDSYLQQINQQANITELLIVSGSIIKKINTLDILKYLQIKFDNNQIHKSLIISVAYNCQNQNQENENYRLKSKLSFGIVNKVYIQITDDIQKILAAIDFIKNLNPKIIICVCVFQPSQSSLAKFKFRPWKGVTLSSNFLSNYQTAGAINKQNLIQLQTLNVEVVFTV